MVYKTSRTKKCPGIFVLGNTEEYSNKGRKISLDIKWIGRKSGMKNQEVKWK